MIGGFESWQGQGIFLFTTASRPALWPTQPPIQWVPEAFYPEVKRPVCEGDYSSPSIGEVKNSWSYASTPQYVFMSQCIIKQWIRLHWVILC